MLLATRTTAPRRATTRLRHRVLRERRCCSARYRRQSTQRAVPPHRLPLDTRGTAHYSITLLLPNRCQRGTPEMNLGRGALPKWHRRRATGCPCRMPDTLHLAPVRCFATQPRSLVRPALQQMDPPPSPKTLPVCCRHRKGSPLQAAATRGAAAITVTTQRAPFCCSPRTYLKPPTSVKLLSLQQKSWTLRHSLQQARDLPGRWSLSNFKPYTPVLHVVLLPLVARAHERQTRLVPHRCIRP